MSKKDPFFQTFARDVKKGLTDHPKHLSSKYIYDDRGDKLFTEIMALPEYYLTAAEMQVIQENKSLLRKQFCDLGSGLDLIELGAGDGQKTIHLLRELSEHGTDFTYVPVDISQHAIDGLTQKLAEELPDINVRGKQGTYLNVLSSLAEYNKRPKVIMMLGSNLGNMKHKKAIEFLRKISGVMAPHDRFFMGLDQKKDPLTIQRAYSDKSGVTEAFNRNLLYRLNKEMGADFKPEKFDHWETYDPETGMARSYLLATEAMTVHINDLNLQVEFREWETIHTEISQKYDDPTVEWLAEEARLTITDGITDKKGYYKNYTFKPS